METAVLPIVRKIYPGGGWETAVLWQHGFRNGRIGNGPQLTKFTQVVGWETAVLPAAYEIYPGGRLETAVLWQHGFRNGRIGNGPQLTKIIQVVDGNGRSARSS